MNKPSISLLNLELYTSTRGGKETGLQWYEKKVSTIGCKVPSEEEILVDDAGSGTSSSAPALAALEHIFIRSLKGEDEGILQLLWYSAYIQILNFYQRCMAIVSSRQYKSFCNDICFCSFLN